MCDKRKKMDIGKAVAFLKKGFKISRELWKDDGLHGEKKFINLANEGKSIWVHFGNNPGFHWSHDHHDLLANDYFVLEENNV